MRKFATDASPRAQELVNALPEEKDRNRYRQLMTDLGGELARVLSPQLPSKEDLVLICTNEDADFLARGLLEELQTGGCQVALVCYWNDRVKLGFGEDRSPIVRRYAEPSKNAKAFIVVKSIISSSCVVRTNISDMVYDHQPEKVFVVSPVLLAGAQERLQAEFPDEIARRFEFIWIAEDDERKENGEVVPGIGGSVYELLGVGSSETKNQFVPDLVKSRRRAFHPAC